MLHELPNQQGAVLETWAGYIAPARELRPAAGGWSDVTTLIRCYQQTDDDTLLRVMNEPRKVTERAKSG